MLLLQAEKKGFNSSYCVVGFRNPAIIAMSEHDLKEFIVYDKIIKNNWHS
jgi:hypothetical protein